MLCSCPKLTPLQSRFLASVAALALLGLIYWSLSDAHFAYAAELEIDGSGRLRSGEDHNWHRIEEQQLEEDGISLDDYEAFGHEEVKDWRRRRESAATAVVNNDANIQNIQAGETTLWVFPKAQLNGPHGETGPGLPENVQKDAITDVKHAELRKRESGSSPDEQESHLEVRQGDSTRTVYISVNTCLQPDYVGSGTQSAAPPQLTLYISTDASNSDPGPDQDSSGQTEIVLDEGFGNFSTQADDDTYISVHAPRLDGNFSGVWNYEIAVSIDTYFHSVDLQGPNLFLIDSDTTSALLVTNNLTQANATQQSYKEWMALKAPYIVFASNVNDTSTLGISNSFCGLKQKSQITGNQDDPSGDSTSVQMQMITRGLGNKPKEQFYISSLNSSSSYNAVLARAGNSTMSGSGVVGGGGKVWQTTTFPTKSDGNCALLYNLTFCNEVAYAVPSTPDFTANYTNFQFFYDNYTQFYYNYFNYSLQQIPCHTTSDAQYSLAKNCDDCAAAYKTWLCAVSIPRCEDFSNEAPYLQPRNMGQKFYNNNTYIPSSYLNASYTPMPSAPTLEGTIAFDQTYISSLATNSSRNPSIDQVIAPGPYKEVLPCEDLCYSLVQSCPAALGFGCPYPGRGLEAGYGSRKGNGNGTLTCSYLGAYVYTDAASGLLPGLVRAVVMAILVGMGLTVF